MDASTPDDVPAFSPDPVAPVTERVSFTGTGGEYFRIWIVNFALTIVTFGIYSAWAKVRRLQYFYRNTHLAGASFDYHGDPIAIFKGRLIAGALFLAYSFAGTIHPALTIVAMAVLGAVIPWMISRSLRFRAHNSSYRGLRFRFDGSTRSAYWLFLAMPVLTVLSFFTLGPLWHHRLKRYQFSNTSYGQVRFGFAAAVGDFYVTYIAAAGIGVGAGGAFMGALLGGAAAVAVTGNVEEDGNISTMVATALFAVAIFTYVATIMAVQAFTTARLRNVVWNGLTIGQRRFTSDVQVLRLAGIMVTNLIATIATLGLFWPFAQVRLARYMAGTLAMIGPASFDEFLASAGPDEQAIGEELTDMFDFDIAF